MEKITQLGDHHKLQRMGLPHEKVKPDQTLMSATTYSWETAKYEAREKTTITHVDAFHNQRELDKRVGPSSTSKSNPSPGITVEACISEEDMDALMGFDESGYKDPDDVDQDEEEDADEEEEKDDDSDKDDDDDDDGDTEGTSKTISYTLYTFI
jgi:TATA-binding protein-associated factor Taf7